LQGREPGQEIKNPNNYLTVEFQNTMFPMSFKGQNGMAWDYFDTRDFTCFNYIPVIRRVRQSSGVARSDPSFGSDSWNDLAYGWGGKNRSMKWKLVGEKTILVPFTNTKQLVAEEKADGTQMRHVQAAKFVFETPGAKGVNWSPVNVTWVPRDCWVVEQLPKDPYYNWGLHVNYVDKANSMIMLKEIYDKAGQFRSWRYFAIHYQETPSGNNNVGDYDYTVTIDEKSRHATIQRRTDFPDAQFYMPASRLGLEFFSMNNFMKLSK
jgi:hypothetical protein